MSGVIELPLSGLYNDAAYTGISFISFRDAVPFVWMRALCAACWLNESARSDILD